MAAPRAHHTATRIADDALLVAGGRTSDGKPTARAELFDGYDQAWIEMAPMTTPRSHHTAIALPGGKVIVIGGTRLQGAKGATAEIEIFDPVVRKWSRAAPMSRARTRHASTLLRDGSVLVTGGCGEEGRLADAEVYEPRTDTWRPAASMRSARSDHTLTTLDDGSVLAAGRGANGGDGCEAYEVSQDRWLRRPSPRSTPTAHTASLLPDGSVLVTGGIDTRGSSVGNADIYYPRWMTWGESEAHPACDGHAVVGLADGGVVLMGGLQRSRESLAPAMLEHCLIFDPDGGTWNRGPIMPRARYGHTATLLPHTGIVVCGGYSAFETNALLESCDLLTPSWEGFSRVT